MPSTEQGAELNRFRPRRLTQTPRQLADSARADSSYVLVACADWSCKLVIMQVTATEFKAKCLGLMERVKKTHEAILITKRGEIIAQLAPPPAESKKPWLALRGMAKIKGDIVSPTISDKEVQKWIKREAKHIRGVFN